MPEKGKKGEEYSKEHLVHLITTDKALLQTLAKAISSCIVEHLLQSQDVLTALISSITKSDEFLNAIGNGRQEIYQSVSMDLEHSRDKIKVLEDHCESLKQTVSDLDDEVDQLQQYSRRNCLLFHGVTESDQEKTDEPRESFHNNHGP